VNATTLAMSGDRFQCVATGFGGSIMSSVATLTVNSLTPAISRQPESATVQATTNVKFRVVAKGPGPLTYAWERNQVKLKNGPRVYQANTATLILRRVVFADAGNYRVVITGPNGSTTSKSAKLTVVPFRP
jgi:hypothetical protein